MIKFLSLKEFGILIGSQKFTKQLAIDDSNTNTKFPSFLEFGDFWNPLWTSNQSGDFAMKNYAVSKRIIKSLMDFSSDRYKEKTTALFVKIQSFFGNWEILWSFSNSLYDLHAFNWTLETL